MFASASYICIALEIEMFGQPGVWGGGGGRRGSEITKHFFLFTIQQNFKFCDNEHARRRLFQFGKVSSERSKFLKETAAWDFRDFFGAHILALLLAV